MKRGDILIASPPSPFDKPRPVLVIQFLLLPQHETVTVALITSDLTRNPGVRVPITPSAGNGLRKVSEIVIDNVQTISIQRVRENIGSADSVTMLEVDAALCLFLGLP